MMKAYRITQWGDSHETAESRKLKYLNWVAAPNKHDGLGFSYLKAQPQQDKKDLYCAFKLMVDLASRAPKEERGWLMRGGRPLTANDMAMMTTFEPEIFTKAMEFFSRPEIGWMELADVPEPVPDLPNMPPRSPEPLGSSPGAPGDSAGAAARPPGTPASGGGKSATDPTDRSDKDRSQLRREREGGSVVSADALKLQWGALNQQIKELEARKADLTPEERAILRKKRARRNEIQEQQAAGQFALSGGTA